MTKRYYYIGSSGAFIYDDESLINSTEFDHRNNEPRGAFLTDGKIKTSAAPTDDQDMYRLQDIGILNVEIFTFSGTISSTKSIILADGTFDLFLPKLSDGINRSYGIKNIGSGIITLKPNSFDTLASIEEEKSQPIYSSDCLTIFTNGIIWWAI